MNIDQTGLNCERWLVYGGKGWIGKQLIQTILDARPLDSVHIAKARADNYEAVLEELKTQQPTLVFVCVGRTHGPGCSTIDYLEEPGRLRDNVRDNLYAPLVVAMACLSLSEAKRPHVTYLGTGCIFDGTGAASAGGGEVKQDDEPRFSEVAQPNFFGSSYSVVKGFTDQFMHLPPFKSSVLNLRIRMPISSSSHARDFVTKITGYKKVISIQNSMTVLPTLLPHVVSLCRRRVTGTVNVVNPGSINHNLILKMYKRIIDPTFTWANWTSAEQDRVLKSQRSNNTLNTDLLMQLTNHEVPHVEQAVEHALALQKNNQARYVPKVILITGCCGFIAKHVLKRLFLCYADYVFVNLDALTYAGREDNVDEFIREDKKRYHFVHGDICDAQLVLQILRKYNVDTVMHFAAETHVDRSFANSLIFTRSNVVGTHTLLECVKEVGTIKLFLHVSTDEVYGHTKYIGPDHQLNEESLFVPSNPYSASKAAAEMFVRAFEHSYKIPCIVARPNNTYGGEGQEIEKLIPKMIMLASRNQDLTVHGDGMARRSFVHVADMARAFDLLLHHGKIGEVYNVGSNKELTVLDVVQRIKALFPHSTSKIVHVRDRAFNDCRYFVDSTKIEQMGWSPKVNFDEGLVQCREWYMANYQRWTETQILESLQAHPLKTVVVSSHLQPLAVSSTNNIFSSVSSNSSSVSSSSSSSDSTLARSACLVEPPIRHRWSSADPTQQVPEVQRAVFGTTGMDTGHWSGNLAFNTDEISTA